MVEAPWSDHQGDPWKSRAKPGRAGPKGWADPRALSFFERGVVEPGLSTLLRLFDALGLSQEVL